MPRKTRSDLLASSIEAKTRDYVSALIHEATVPIDAKLADLLAQLADLRQALAKTNQNLSAAHTELHRLRAETILPPADDKYGLTRAKLVRIMKALDLY